MADDYEELLDEAEDEFEQGQDLQDAQIDSYEGGTYPKAKEESSLYTWFWKVVRLKNPSRLVRVGNLNSAEIGEHGVSVRDCLNLAHLGKIFGHDKFGNYWAVKSNTISATSMAKKGWFMDLSISQKKVRERARKDSSQDKQKWRMFNKKKTDTTKEE